MTDNVMQDSELIYDVPPEKRYWVVKSDHGRYFEHFKEHALIAIGHLDQLALPQSSSPYDPELPQLKDKLKKLHKSNRKQQGYTTNHFNQIKNFISDLKLGDWVVTKSDREILIGRVIGNPQISKEPLSVKTAKHIEEDLPSLKFNLRRRVSWGPSISLQSVPLFLRHSLRALQSFYNIDQHRIALHHLLFPWFTYEGSLYLSARVKTRSDISNFYVSNFFNLLNEVEVIGKTFEDVPLTNEDVRKALHEFASNDQFTLTTKASFSSPGDIWAKVQFATLKQLPKGMLYAVVIYAMLFGHPALGMDGIIDIESRKLLWQVVAKRMEAHLFDKTREELELSLPDEDTSKLISNEIDEEQQ